MMLCSCIFENRSKFSGEITAKNSDINMYERKVNKKSRTKNIRKLTAKYEILSDNLQIVL